MDKQGLPLRRIATMRKWMRQSFVSAKSRQDCWEYEL